MPIRAGVRAIAMVGVLGVAAGTHAYYLDGARNFDVRLRAYSQLGILTESSARDGCRPTRTLSGKVLPRDFRICPPQYRVGDLAQHRNFYNPEFDARLTDFVRWTGEVPGLAWLRPEEFKFRFAWWGFYDGLYDYLGSAPWGDNLRAQKARFSQSDRPEIESFRFDDENKKPRRIYGSRNRINELYLDYTKGPVFVRVGRQAISWGEADSIALLDVSNPFDITLGAPGLFMDVDEARIPLWTLRTTIKLLDNWKALSSLFVDAYMVPGPIDTTVPINPIATGVSPFNPDQADPQFNLTYGPTDPPGDAPGQSPFLHTVVVDRLPRNRWENTRWGVRLTGVVARDYTVQAWFFRTFNQAPVPLLSSRSGFDLASKGKLTLIDDRGFRLRPRDCLGADGQPVKKGLATTFGRTPWGRACSWAAPVVTVLERELESVVGLAGTWFSEALQGIIRTEAEYFIDELAFIPTRNLNARAQVPRAIREQNGESLEGNSLPKADYLRWLVGYDRFFFFRPLNPTNSFLISTAFNGSFNLNELFGGRDFRFPQAKPGKRQAEAGPIPGIAACRGSQARRNAFCVRTPPKNFVDQYPFEGFLQTALQTDYLHGRLTPRIVVITDVSGIFAFAPTVTYRASDNLLLTGTYIAIASSRIASVGTFRNHDMLQLRVTLQLN